MNPVYPNPHGTQYYGHPDLWQIPNTYCDVTSSRVDYHITSSSYTVSPLCPSSSASASSTSSSPPLCKPLPRVSQSKKGKSPASRPPNAFLLFRSDLWAREKQKEIPVERDHRDISRIAAVCWNGLDNASKKVYQDRAAKLREQHNMRYPALKCTTPASKTRKRSKKTPENVARCAQLASTLMGDISATSSFPESESPSPSSSSHFVPNTYGEPGLLPVLQPKPVYAQQPNRFEWFESYSDTILNSPGPFGSSQPLPTPPNTMGLQMDWASSLQAPCSTEDLNFLLTELYGSTGSELEEWQALLQTA
ncbi:hypothetical protein FA15DRAFT_642548 [Coprinopsis marcescibilis]|uniref:HMG box domain-containing protein n=1 Tax=Coprinopsis marcescibilis TaxID=230819 RepID=A0A5C3KS20_COPMA|nr:hypothetical protein FA15DRAFT_642548 [Coprinopsis marcescibilis]